MQHLMRHIIIIRHAEAEPHNFRLADHGRALTPNGHADASSLGHNLFATAEATHLHTAHWMVSTAKRTQETAQHIQQASPDPSCIALHTNERLYLAEKELMLEELALLPNRCTSAVIVGHNPGLHELACTLCPPKEAAGCGLYQGLQTATALWLCFTGEWAALEFPNILTSASNMKLVHYIRGTTD